MGEGVHLVVAKFGRGTSWRMRLGLGGTLSWLDGWSLGGSLRWLIGWEAEMDSGVVQEWLRRVSLGEEKGGARIEGEGMPKLQKREKERGISSWLNNLLSWAAHLFW